MGFLRELSQLLFGVKKDQHTVKNNTIAEEQNPAIQKNFYEQRIEKFKSKNVEQDIKEELKKRFDKRKKDMTIVERDEDYQYCIKAELEIHHKYCAPHLKLYKSAKAEDNIELAVTALEHLVEGLKTYHTALENTGAHLSRLRKSIEPSLAWNKILSAKNNNGEQLRESLLRTDKYYDEIIECYDSTIERLKNLDTPYPQDDIDDLKKLRDDTRNNQFYLVKVALDPKAINYHIEQEKINKKTAPKLDEIP